MINKFAKRLKELRIEKEFTQKEVAAAAGVLERTVSYWEKAQRECDIDTLIILSDFFGVTADYLIGKTDI